jgi:glyoxylase-like metal-dependent hydrolase (beta-lactamase superfamily II)
VDGSGLQAPRDPRAGWDLPPLGTMPVVSALDELVTRVLAPNASPMTLDGTNSYLVGAPGAGEVVVVDPGPGDPAHLERLRQAVATADVTVRAVVVTHHHHDHAESAADLAAELGTPVVAADRRVAGPSGRLVGAGDRIAVAGTVLEVVPTPGHCGDHLAFRLPNGSLLTGDHVLGRGTSVVAHPDGDLVAYLDSLRRVLDLGPAVLYPGHGPELREDPGAVLAFYLEHRRYREAQVLRVLADGPAPVAGLVARIYAAVDRRVWPAAEASTRACLAALAAQGRVRLGPDDRAELVPRG